MSEPKQLLYVVSTTKLGGVEQLVLRLGRALRDRYRIEVAVLNGPGVLHDEYCRTFADVLNRWHLYRDRPDYANLKVALGQNLRKADLVHVFNHFAASRVLSRLCPQRLIQSVHFHPDAMPAPWKRYLEESQGRLRAMIVDSKRWEDVLPRARYVPNFVDTDRFLPALELPPHRVLWVGKLNRTKGADQLLEIVLRSPLPFTIVDGVPELPEAEAVRRELTAIGDRVTYIRRADEDTMVRLYRSHSHLLITSRFEGLPLCLLEGMACGMVPVSTPVGGILDVIRPGCNGYFYDSPADACRCLELNPDAIGWQAHQTVRQRYSLDVVLPAFVEIYEGRGQGRVEP